MASTRLGNREIWAKVLVAWKENDQATIDLYVSPDLKIIEPDNLPYAGVFHGPEGYADLFRRISETWVDLVIERGCVIGGDDEDALVIEYFTSARSRATGKVLDREPSLAIWKFHSGKIISMTPFNFDTGRIRAALGKV
jgi:ketosteroid isomerase-like protein